MNALLRSEAAGPAGAAAPRPKLLVVDDQPVNIAWIRQE
jgi:hypothetical protein